MKIDIRDYRDDDWIAIARIHDAARLDELRRSVGVAAFLSLAETAGPEGLFDGHVWVAVVEGRVAGFAALSHAELTWLYVDPPHYRRGVGRALVRHVLSRADGTVETNVLDGNDAAMALYVSEGFVQFDTKSGRLAGNEQFAATGHDLRWQPLPVR